MFNLLRDWYHEFPLYISSQRKRAGCLLTRRLSSAKMKTILACLLVLAISITMSNAACFFEPLKPGTTDGCRDSSGELHEFDSQWRDQECNDCSCFSSGIRCCTSYATPVGFDAEKCISIFNKETCSYKVVEKDNHSKECPVHAWVG